ncbi:hypothetical protein [Parasphingorhabdus sp.]|uniref:hypothetical protein n=1 Tax=Parasphingorhabdus sp. TaxID=2709688 RepID=UPI00326671EA
MRTFSVLPFALTALLLTSCSDDAELPETDNVTETTMDEVDVIDGTISDEMTDVDAEETADGLADDEGSAAEDTPSDDTEESSE